MFRFLIDCRTGEEKRKVVTQAVFFIGLNTTLFSLIYLIISILVNFNYKILFYALIISNILIAIRNAYLRGMGKIKQYALINFVSSIVLIISNVVFIAVMKTGVVGLFWSQILVGLLSLLIIVPFLRKYVSVKSTNRKQIKEMIKYSLPLVPNSISWAIINTSDRLVISSSIGAGANGVYSISNKFPTIVDTVYGFFYTAWKESAAKSLKDEGVGIFYNQVYSNLKNALFSVVALIIGFMPFVFSMLVKNDFTEAYLYIPILIISIFFANLSGFYGGIFTAYKNTKIMGITTLAAAIINLVVDFVLIHYVGLWAAAISTLVSTFFMFIYRRIVIKKYVKLNESIREILLNGVVLTMLLISFYLGNTLFNIMAAIICCIYCLSINRKVIKLLKTKLLRRKK